MRDFSTDYAYRVDWSPEDNELVGLLAEFPSLSWLAPTAVEAMQGIVGVVEQVAAEMADSHDVDGLPVGMPGRIIADLARDQLDGAHRATVIADVLEAGLLTLNGVGARLDPYVHQWDEADGVPLARRFLAAAGRAARLRA